jgi:hypothetical protein
MRVKIFSWNLFNKAKISEYHLIFNGEILRLAFDLQTVGFASRLARAAFPVAFMEFVLCFFGAC